MKTTDFHFQFTTRAEQLAALKTVKRAVKIGCNYEVIAIWGYVNKYGEAIIEEKEIVGAKLHLFDMVQSVMYSVASCYRDNFRLLGFLWSNDRKDCKFYFLSKQTVLEVYKPEHE